MLLGLITNDLLGQPLTLQPESTSICFPEYAGESTISTCILCFPEYAGTMYMHVAIQELKLGSLNRQS